VRFLIAGLGSIGRRHLRNLVSLGQRDIILYRTYTSTLQEDELSAFPVVTDLKEALLRKPDAVIISNPTAFHMKIAVPAAKSNCALMIEKPIAYHPEELLEFEPIIEQNKNKVLTAFQFRFHPGLKKIKHFLDEGKLGRPVSFRSHWGEFLPDWHPWEDYRKSYAARHEMGGGVVLTLCHPIDYLRWLFGEIAEVFAVTEKISTLEISVEDHAEALLRFKNGVFGNLHLDYYRRPKYHGLEIACTEGVMSWDETSGNVVLEKPGKDKEVIPSMPETERNTMFVDEMNHFLHMLEKDEQPMCGYENGKKALQLAWGILQSGRYHTRVIFD